MVKKDLEKERNRPNFPMYQGKSIVLRNSISGL
jgi:hypothetical protein